MFSFRYDFSDLGDPSTLSEQADLNCWAEGADDAGWNLVSASGNSDLDPWLEAPLNNIGPDLALENVELTCELKACEKIRLSFFVINGGEQLDTAFNATIELVQGDERSMVGRSVFYSMDANTAKSVKRSFTAPEGDWTLEITVDQEGLVWEIDETNNVWNRTVSASSSAFGRRPSCLEAVQFWPPSVPPSSCDDEAMVPLNRKRSWLPSRQREPQPQRLPSLPLNRLQRNVDHPEGRSRPHLDKRLPAGLQRAHQKPNPRQRTNQHRKKWLPCTWRHLEQHRHHRHRLRKRPRIIPNSRGAVNTNTRQKGRSMWGPHAGDGA